MNLKDIFIYGLFHRIISTNRSSRWFGVLTNARLYKPLLRLFIMAYISFFRIDMSEYDFDINTANTFNEFFTRQLKTGVRTWGTGICAPVDGRMLSYGPIQNGQIFQVKGKNYSEQELTGQEKMVSGSFVNLYLSPANYHRVHAPFDMQINKVTHIPGKLLSVSKKNAETVDNLYSKNERVVLTGTSEFGTFHFVFVGATNVGSIRLSFDSAFRSNLKNARLKSFETDQKIALGKEIGWFEMGSTVIVLIESAHLENVKEEFLDEAVNLGKELVD